MGAGNRCVQAIGGGMGAFVTCKSRDGQHIQVIEGFLALHFNYALACDEQRLCFWHVMSSEGQRERKSEFTSPGSERWYGGVQYAAFNKFGAVAAAPTTLLPPGTLHKYHLLPSTNNHTYSPHTRARASLPSSSYHAHACHTCASVGATSA